MFRFFQKRIIAVIIMFACNVLLLNTLFVLFYRHYVLQGETNYFSSFINFC